MRVCVCVWLCVCYCDCLWALCCSVVCVCVFVYMWRSIFVIRSAQVCDPARTGPTRPDWRDPPQKERLSLLCPCWPLWNEIHRHLQGLRTALLQHVNVVLNCGQTWSTVTGLARSMSPACKLSSELLTKFVNHERDFQCPFSRTAVWRSLRAKLVDLYKDCEGYISRMRALCSIANNTR